MASVAASRKLKSPSCKHSCKKCRLSHKNNISLDTSRLSIQMNDTNSYETFPSPSSTVSTSTIERPTKYRHRILSSTLKIKTKDDHSNQIIKRRLRYNKLFHQTQLVNRQYMLTITNLLFQMQKEVLRLKRRTHRVEQYIIKQTKNVQPIIRIPRLTKDQLSTICVNDTDENVLEEENEPISDNNNNEIIIPLPNIKSRKTKRLTMKRKHSKKSIKLARKHRRHIWENNRQRPIDPNRYCSSCQHEFAKRSNFVLHVKRIHKGKFPPSITEQDQSLLEMNQEDFQEHTEENPSNEITNDQSVVVMDHEAEPLQVLINQENGDEGRLLRISKKSNYRKSRSTRIKCDICGKIYRIDYMKKHKRRAHPDQELISLSSEAQTISDEIKSASDKASPEYHSTHENPLSIDQINTQDPTTSPITIAEMETDDEPIRFRADSNKSIVLAVTCLEPYQIELVEQFAEKFSSIVCQTTSIDSRATHLITNDEQNSLRSPLSMKLIEAIAHHCYCVSYRWIIDCIKYDRIIDEEPYEIEGDDTEVYPHGGPRRARLISNRHSLFQDICFMIKCTENSDIRMTNERLEDLITTCGGQIITCVTQRFLEKYKIIVLCDMSYVSERRHNYDQCRQLGIHFVSSDWVLESILEYRQKPFSLFEEVPL